MRLVTLKEVQGNEIAACNLTDIHGRLLLSKGSRIKLSYLNKLESLGISSVYIEDEISEGIKIEGILCEETKHLAKSTVEVEMRRFLKTNEVDTEEIRKVSNVIVNEILLNRVQLINLKDLKLKGEYIFSHCVNVCALSIFLCKKMGIEHSKANSIGAGALLHDFGKLLVPNDILDKTGKLSEDEFEEVKKHTTYGYEAFKEDWTVSPTTKTVILMHHEKVDGSGYPNGLKGDKINDAAKICSICNAFDSRTSDRHFRKASSISDAVEYLYCTAGIFYDKKFVEEFLKYVPIYPEGTVVLLNTGVIAIVIRNNTESILRPVVRFLYNLKTKVKYSNLEVNMMQELTLKIEKEVVFDYDEFRLL